MATWLLVTIIVAAVATVATVVTLIVLNRSKLKTILKEHKEKKNAQKVAFGDTAKIISENAEELLKSAPKMSMDDLEKLADEMPYFVVDVDENHNNVGEFISIKADNTEDDINDMMKNTKGILLFD